MQNRVKVGVALLATIPTWVVAKEQPNLIIIMTDEHNFRTLSCYRESLPDDQAKIWGEAAAKIETPNIDRIAKMGVMMQNFNSVQPVSSPSRGSFFTGLYPQRNGVVKNDLFMNEDVRTIGDELRDEGYQTGYCGKLHLYGDSKPGWQPQRDFGFTDNRYMFNRGHWKILRLGAEGEGIAENMGKTALEDLNEDIFTTDFLTNRTLEYIDENYDKPFCYVLNIPDPHDPNTVREPYASMYNDIPFEMPMSSTHPNGQLSWQRASEDLAFYRSSNYFAHYFGMVSCIDLNVGRVLDKLEQRGILDNTIVVFTADHGDMMGEHNRDNKDVPYVASMKVPMLIYYKDKIVAGSIATHTMGSVDFVPTILSMMGVEAKQQSDGRDMSDLLAKNQMPDGCIDMVISKMQTWIAAVTPRYKLIFTKTGQVTAPVLYDLQEDPHELYDLYGDKAYEAQIKEMAQFILDYMQQHDEPLYKDLFVVDSVMRVINDK